MEGYRVFYKDKKGHLKTKYFRKPKSSIETEKIKTEIKITRKRNFKSIRS